MIEKPIASKDIAPKREYHFAGSGTYLPQTILASSREEAEKTWLRTRKRAEPEEKVEEINSQEEQ